ncbi:metalloregulator ArsR/SmtB family transcription factor [Nisaea acidiphila]|uniref:Metalloregulator ArsR/SmtB family transcription factor n=1 Tax=Nisaea acidiphila TaxID=1862145 RepID=A0A9J7AXQ5_9PROT|nr:metalloregulator ArsR/SmtB family transcription factor [Nisaea acidiphila]UUX51854.1 metalloregulator ArsR/SmtB family transcription factor [Nisaea acidiphila]
MNPTARASDTSVDNNFVILLNNEMKASSEDVYSALSSPVRRQVLGLLRERAMSAGELADEVSVSKPTLSGHLNILKGADLVTVERLGAVRLYRINLSVVEEALASLMQLLRIDTGSSAFEKESKTT